MIETVDCSHLGDPAGCVHLINLFRFLQNVSTKAVHQIGKTVEHIHNLIPEYGRERVNLTGRRVGRGLFDFVGELSHSLFGTARDSDIDNVHKTLEHLGRQQQSLLSAWQQAEGRLASYGTAVNHRLDTMDNMIQTQKQAIQDLYLAVTRESSQASKASSILAKAFSRLEDFVILLDHLNAFQRGLELL